MSKKTEPDYLHPVPLDSSECDRCTNREERKKHEIEGYCNVVDCDDNLQIRCVGDWGKDKVTFLRMYVSIVAQAMKSKFNKINYIEICSGPGRCVDNHNYNLFDGSPLTVLTCDNAKYISNFLFIDYDNKTIDILKQRVKISKRVNQEIKDKSKMIIGDYTKPKELINKIKKEIPQQYNTLNIFFIDPTSFEVPFELYREILNQFIKVDFIINFPIGMDLNRNICKAIKIPNSTVFKKYQLAVPYPNKLKSAEYQTLAFHNENYELVNKIKTDILKDFGKYGFCHTMSYKIKNYYELIYFTKEKIGLKFWEIATKKTSNDIENQQLFLF